MKTFEFKAPDGKTYEVKGPDSATNEQAFAVLQHGLQNGSIQAKAAPKPETTLLQDAGNFVADHYAGLARGAVDVGLGILQAPKLVGLPPIGGQEFIDNSKKSWNDFYAGKTNIDGSASERGERGFNAGVSRFAGQMAGTAGISGAKVLGAAKYVPQFLKNSHAAAAGVEGAASGVLTGDGNWSDAGIGAAGGVGMQQLLSRAGRLISSPTRQTPQAEALRRAGIEVTAGQGSDGVVSSLERAAQYIPAAANAVKAQRAKPYTQLREVLAREAQPPVNALDPTAPVHSPTGGHMDEVLANARRNHQTQYDDVLKGRRVDVDPQFEKEVADLFTHPPYTVSDSEAATVSRVVRDFLNRGRQAGGWDAPDLSMIRQRLQEAANGSTPEKAKMIEDVSNRIFQMMVRQHPDIGTVQQVLAPTYRNLTTLEEAAKGAVAQGEFGVSQLAHAAEKTGNTRMRDFGRAAATVLKDDLNSGGTGVRTAIGLGALGAGYGVGGAPGAGATAALPLALYLGLGTRTGQKALAGQFKTQKRLAEWLRKHPDAGGVTGGVAAQDTFGD